MPTTKSGMDTPADPPKQKPEAPVKEYPASSKLGSPGPKGTVKGPAEDAFQGRRRK